MGIGQELSVVNVSKYYGSFLALDNVSLRCESGQFVSILGSSGSGKTTLLKVIAGFERCSDGKIFINGKDVASVPCNKRNIGMLFQNYALFPHLTVAQNIAYPLKIRNLSKREIGERVERMVSLIKLDGLADRLPSQLSGGQQQRVALGRAIVYNPPLLLLDEPLGALDKNLRHEMQFEIRRLTTKLGITTLSVTHDQEEAFSMSDRICIVSGGKIQQFGTPEEIYEHPQNRFTAQFMGTTNIIPLNSAVYAYKNGVCSITGRSPIGNAPFTLECAQSEAKKDERDLVFALRPESVHLVLDDESHENCFEAKINESVYLGQFVRARALAGSLELNVTLDVKDYRALDLTKNVRFRFAPRETAVLYN